MQAVPYLGFNGQCKAAFEYFQQCLGGQIVAMMTHGDTPMAEHTPPEARDKIMHARLVAGDLVLMGGDSPSEESEPPHGFCVALQVDEPAEADRIFEGLAEGGQVQMPIGETFWARRFGMLVDRFGIPWMVNCENAGAVPA